MIKPSLTDRLAGAHRLLFKRGDDAVVCSFCGQGKDKQQRIVAGPGVAICGTCADIARQFAYVSTFPQPPDGTKRVVIVPILEPGDRIPDEHRTNLPKLVAEIASAEGCELYNLSIGLIQAPASDFLAFDVITAADTDEATLSNALKARCRERLGLPVTTDPGAIP